MSSAILKGSSLQAEKTIEINHEKSLTYIDHYEDGFLVATFVMKRDDWEIFILSEMAEIR